MKKNILILLLPLLIAATSVIGITWIIEDGILKPGNGITGIDISGISEIDGVTEDYIFVREEQPANIYGGSATAGVYVTRNLNTELVDYGGFALLTSNRIRLAPGHYRISARLPAYSIGRHWGRLYSFSNSTTVIMGSTHYTGSGASQTDAIISGSFDVDSTEDFSIQHQTQLSLVTQGLGVSNQVEKSIFTEVELWREKRR